MIDKRETAPIRAVAFGLLAIVLSWVCVAIYRSGSIDLTLRVNRVPTVFQLNRGGSGWQFELVVAVCVGLALACAVAFALAIIDLFKSEEGEK
jgi:hypothetical protein